MEMTLPQEFYLANIWIGLIVIVVMFGIFYYIGWYSLKKTKATADLYVAGSTIGPVVNGLAMSSTWASLATFLGVSALILKLQAPFVYLWLQWALSIPLITLLYGTSMRRMGAFTPCTFIKARYGNGATVTIALWMILVMIMYALGQMIGLGQTFELLFGVPYGVALLIAGIAAVGYIAIGGMYGASYNAAFQMCVMLIAMIVPMGAIMKAMGSSGWWFPPLAYGDMVPQMLKLLPDFFEPRYDFRWYFSLIPAFTLGPLALPHLAARVFTSRSVKDARWAVVWFVFFLGLLFSGAYVVGFAGNYFTATTGTAIPRPDQITLILNIMYNPIWVAAFVLGGALAAGVSTLNGNLMAIAALVGSDLLNVWAPTMEDKKKLRIGFICLAIGGAIALLLAFRPPKFLVTSILWAFGLLGSTAVPAILLGVWWKQANKLALIVSSIVCGVIFIVISPHVIPSICVGKGLTAALGMSGGLVTIPLSFALFIVLSILFNKVPALEHYKPTMEDMKVIDRIHGWPDYDDTRYNGRVWPWVVVVVCLLICYWGLLPY